MWISNYIPQSSTRNSYVPARVDKVEVQNFEPLQWTNPHVYIDFQRYKTIRKEDRADANI